MQVIRGTVRVEVHVLLQEVLGQQVVAYHGQGDRVTHFDLLVHLHQGTLWAAVLRKAGVSGKGEGGYMGKWEGDGYMGQVVGRGSVHETGGRVDT